MTISWKTSLTFAVPAALVAAAVLFQSPVSAGAGRYKLDGNKISIGPAASTMMLCGEPEGVMEQEAAYLKALESAATFAIEGQSLTLLAADGALEAGATITT